MAWTAFGALLSHWRKHKVQLAMLLLGLALATALWSGVQAINAEARASYAKAAALLGQNRLSELVRRDGGTIPLSLYVDLRRRGYQLSPMLSGDIRIAGKPIHLIGIDPLSVPHQAAPEDFSAAGSLPAFLSPPGLMLVSQSTADALKGEAPLAVRVVKDVPYGTAITDIGVAARLLSLPDAITNMIVLPENAAPLRDLATIAPGLMVKKPDGEGDLARLTDSFHLNLTAFGLLSFVVGLFIVYAAVRLAFEQRRATFRTLRSLGLPVRMLLLLLSAEMLLFSVIAGLIGVALGYVIASMLLPDVALTLRGLYGADVPGSLQFRPQWWATGLAIAVLGALASAGQGLWSVWRMPLLQPAKPRAWAMASERIWWMQAAVAIMLFIAAAGLVWWGRGLLAGFAALGALLLAAALLLPVLLTPALKLLQVLARGPVMQWFFADTRQQLPGLSLALMALLLALATNIGVGTMVSSFRLTFVGWLDQRLAAELYVSARSDAEAARLQAWLAARVDAVLPIWSTKARIGGKIVTVHGVVDDPVYRQHWPLLETAPKLWDRLAAGDGVLINEQMMRRENRHVGSMITLPGNLREEVLGVYSDYGNPEEDVMIAQSVLVSHFSDLSRQRFGLRLAKDKVDALKAELIDDFGLPAENIVDQSALKRRSLEIFEKTFAITAALNILTLAVAGVAIFASLTTLSTMRLPQLAPVWAMGLTRRSIITLELLRTLVLAALTMIAAIPVGLALAWMLLAVVNVEAFGWRLPMHLFPGQWLHLALLSLAAAFLAALLPLWGLARRKPADLLRIFANER
ncbi:FtsX-like permease family protein [Allorhizobium sp. BGMRC 0089]|uniref:FtsX-like permease family protein n=1 Tax=Allorhizobium sonneratiae TaxID=2934936 RepID=UPI0020344996|nr:FtsX-like permease family protein [Allorhizobium sonneratiae]MCM2293188.1 FtsX-like permease family protein [Allorhizobium sonneratiae]